MSPLDWICPLLAVDADAFNPGDTSEFAAISAVAVRHNEISQTLSTTPSQFDRCSGAKPMAMSIRDPDAKGFYAAMRLRLLAWAPLLDVCNVSHACCCPSCCTVATIRVGRCTHITTKRPRDCGLSA